MSYFIKEQVAESKITGKRDPDLPRIARGQTRRPPIAILGVPFDNVSVQEAIGSIEEMIQSREPHYVVTANVDFLVQASRDVELRRILAEAQLVLCDGMPLVWASRWLGNRLLERVAGADLVPLLIRVASRKGYRLFLLGASVESARLAVENLQARYPSLVIAGHYSPPFASLLDMDHAEIKRRIDQAKPDILLVSFGCPKQEKWMWMHYRTLGVPVSIGVGATIDFLAGRVKRAPVWMQRTGVEWIFRLAQEPRRLVKRYAKDLVVFGWGILPQLWHLQIRRVRRWVGGESRTEHSPENESETSGNTSNHTTSTGPLQKAEGVVDYQLIELPEWLDAEAVYEWTEQLDETIRQARHSVLAGQSVEFIDSTGIGLLIKLHKRLKLAGKTLVLLAPSPALKKALKVARLTELFHEAGSLMEAERLLRGNTIGTGPIARPRNLGVFQWDGEVTAVTVDQLWEDTSAWLRTIPEAVLGVIDLERVSFMDSSGLGLMVRTKKAATHLQRRITFSSPRPPVRNVVQLARLEEFLLK